MEPALSETPESPVLGPVCDKSGHEIGGDFSSFLFRYGVGRILFTTLKDVFQCAAISGRASTPKQFDGQGWNRQQEGDQDCREGAHRE
jgi:hypothetical protein